jgi:hypothetical protein
MESQATVALKPYLAISVHLQFQLCERYVLCQKRGEQQHLSGSHGHRHLV